MKTLTQIFETIETNKKELEFLPTGFSSVDEHLDGGFLRKELVVLGGHTGIGKSYVAGQILWNIAQKGFKTAYFSLEISNEMVVSRLIGSLANIKPTRVLAGLLTKEEYESKLKAKGTLSAFEKFMTFYDSFYTLTDISNQIKGYNYEFVVIDFIQNIISKGQDEYSRLSHIALELQKLAKTTNSCILVLSQLSNQAAREGNKSTVVEYKGSGSIAMVCDLGFFIEREKGLEETQDIVRLNLRKNRRGISGVAFEFVFKQPGGMIV
jgi:replicative DNA helicase